MTARFERVRSLVLSLESLSPEDRARALDSFCAGDPELRREVESLLAVDESLSLEMVQTMGASPILAKALSNMPVPLPATIGGYRILGLLGRGGMGDVYHAEQTDPIRREVAIKRAAQGLDAEAVLARFEVESQALAQMEHPGIARVFDAGTDVDGRPYFVMELVRGQPITEFCSDRHLSRRERLRLFCSVCYATQHAHQKGILHRDLKPSNILVYEELGGPVAKVIDFGIAKPLADCSRADITREGQVLGTIEYMSPEQLAGKPVSTDTRSDVYALGAVLHELLTGALPHDVRGKSLLEAIRVVTNDSSSWKRGTRPAGLDEDLLMIIDRAIARDPDCRYPTAAALAQDIERWLAGQPVDARPPSTTYILRKLAARNRVPALLAATLFVLSIASTIGLAGMYRTERRAHARAQTEAAKARAVSGFLSDMLASVEGEGRDVTLREVISAAARRVERHRGAEPEIEASVRSALGAAYTAMSEFEMAETQLESSLRIREEKLGKDHEDVAESLGRLAALARVRDGGTEGIARADSLSRRAYEIRHRALGPRHRLTLEALGELASFRRAGGDPAADSLYRHALAIAEDRFGSKDGLVADLLLGRSECLWNNGDQRGAHEILLRALAIYRELHPGDHESTAECLRRLTFTSQVQREQDSLMIEYLAMERRLWGEDALNLCRPLEMVAGRLRTRARHEEGLRLLHESLAIRKRHYPEGHVSVAGTHNSLGVAMLDMERYDEARELLEKALAVMEAELGAGATSVHICRTNVALALAHTGRSADAIELLRAGLALAGPPGDHNTTAALYHRRMADVLAMQKRWFEAESHAAIAVRAFGARLAGSPNHAYALRSWATSLHHLGRCDEALRLFPQSDSILVSREQWAGWSSERVRWSECLSARGQSARAIDLLKEANDRLIDIHGPRDPTRVNVLLALVEILSRSPEDRLSPILAADCRSLLLDGDPRLARLEELDRRITATMK